MIWLLACADSGPATVVLVVLDTVRADVVAEGPTWRRLAAEGRSWTDASSVAPWTFPSHGALFSGLDPEACGCTSATLRCDDGVELIAEGFQAAGYATLGLSNNPWVSPDTGLAAGHDDFFEVFRGVYGLDRAVARYVDPWTTGLADAGAARSVGILDRWLEARPGEPVFVFLNLIEAHYPYDPPEGWRGRRRDGAVLAAADRAGQDRWLTDAHAGSLDPADIARAQQLYREEVDYLDARLAGLLEVLERQGRGDALLVLTADHGEAFAAHRLGRIQLVDHQLSLHQELLHVPLLVRWPGVVEAASVETRPVPLTDVAPFLRWARDGGEAPALLDPPADRLLRASYVPPISEAEVFADLDPATGPALARRSLRSVRRGPDKLVLASDGQLALHDLDADPDEQVDLAADRPDLVGELRPLLPPEPSLPEGELPLDAAGALRALGYLP